MLFLDTWHTTFAGAVYARKPLIDMLERLIGPDDLFAVMTPDMDPRHITFARRTETLDNALRKNTQWGMRDDMIKIHPEEQALEMCFPGIRTASASSPAAPSWRSRPMPIAAWPPNWSPAAGKGGLDSLEGLVRFLGASRRDARR